LLGERKQAYSTGPTFSWASVGWLLTYFRARTVW